MPLAALLFCATPAAADEVTQSARGHYTQGTKLYDLGRCHDAAREYEAAFELKDDPALYATDGTTIRAITSTGTVSTVVGSTAGFVDGSGCALP